MFYIIIIIAGIIPAYFLSKALGHVLRPDWSFFGVKEVPGPKPLTCPHCGIRVKREPNKSLCPNCRKLLQ